MGSLLDFKIKALHMFVTEQQFVADGQSSHWSMSEKTINNQS